MVKAECAALKDQGCLSGYVNSVKTTAVFVLAQKHTVNYQ